MVNPYSAYFQSPHHILCFGHILSEDCSSQSIFTVIGSLYGFIDIREWLHHTHDGCEYFISSHSAVIIHINEDSRFNIESILLQHYF